MVARKASLGNSENLHKSKMAARRHLEKSTLRLFITECCAICLFRGLFEYVEFISDVIFAF